jgi:hypothetical protein
MRPGGGGPKGAAFERKTGLTLSLWLTQGGRTDLFSRNVLSGGRFTLASKKGEVLGVPGDLMAAHPLAFEFLSNFLVECKHTASIQLDQFVFDRVQKTWLSKVIAKAAKEADSMGLDYLVVACQNRRPAMAFMPGKLTSNLLKIAYPRGALRYHRFHRDTILACAFDDLVTHIRPDLFLASLPPKEPMK